MMTMTTMTMIIMMWDDNNVTAQLYILTWPLSQISQKTKRHFKVK